MSRQSCPNRYVILAVTALGMFAAVGFGRDSFGVLLPSLQKGLDISTAQAGAVATTTMVVYILVAGMAGVLVPRLGYRNVLGSGTLLAGASMICTGVAPGLVAVVASRAFGGIGAGLCVVPAVSMVWRWFSDRQRGFASSFVFAGPSLAGVLLGPVGLRLIARYGPEGWRVPWFVFGALTLVAGLLIWAVIRDPSSQSRPRGENMSGSTARGWSGVAYWNLLRSPLLLRLALVYVALGFSAGIFMNLFMKRLIDDLGYSGEPPATCT